MTENITPVNDNVVLKVLPTEKQIGSIVIPGQAREKSTLCEVLIPNQISYHRDGSLRPTFLKEGMKVRIPTGKVGTGMPEAPDGEEWVCVPEDMIYYIVG